MKKLLLLTATVLFTASAYSQEDGGAEMQAWIEYATPGEVHEMLASYTGTWKEEATHYMGEQEIKTEGTATYEMIMEGRYLQSMHEGDMMGMPFRGISTTGYDKAKQVFVVSWVDNMGTGMMYGEGKWDARSRTIEFKGMMTDPVSKKGVPYREVLTLKDENTMSMVMYATKDGKEVKIMAIKYTRE